MQVIKELIWQTLGGCPLATIKLQLCLFRRSLISGFGDSAYMIADRSKVALMLSKSWMHSYMHPSWIRPRPSISYLNHSDGSRSLDVSCRNSFPPRTRPLPWMVRSWCPGLHSLKILKLVRKSMDIMKRYSFQLRELPRLRLKSQEAEVCSDEQVAANTGALHGPGSGRVSGQHSG